MMGKKSTLAILAFAILMILNGCGSHQEISYAIKEASSENWRFNGGELVSDGGEEELKYIIDYIGNEERNPVGLTFEFSIFTKDSHDKNVIDQAEHLFSDTNGVLRLDDKYSKKDSFKGQLLDSEKDYDFEHLFLRISFKEEGKDHEELIKLTLEKM